METITRKTLLYKSGLGFYCLNHFQGCSHGCRYPCYAWMMAHSHGRVDTYSHWREPKLVANAAGLLSVDLARLKIKPEYIHLCLTTDPFMYGFPEVTDLSLELMSIINSQGIRCSVLTKGVLPVVLADPESFSEDNIYGISLISLNEECRRRWEPGAAPYSERIRALKSLHDCGCHTLVHMEPYPTPNILKQSLEEILRAVEFADEIFFSGWNYNQVVKQYTDYKKFYVDQAEVVRRFCNSRSIGCDSVE
jgi:DNA repair photolyase